METEKKSITDDINIIPPLKVQISLFNIIIYF